MRIRKIAPGEAPPMALLLLADPSEEAVASYLDTAECFIAEADDAVVGTYVTRKISEDRAEVFNIAVAEAWQGRGINRAISLIICVYISSFLEQLWKSKHWKWYSTG
ncbi:GNAT family N-acetyltransferase [Salinicoccus luteus]|uniref:GNAT family N-acetyltransferase n=1 Tax=Salinicoccus luteus TaxID=367840 RepID=UPI00068E2ADF|nr:GNAT family N-acetyltransferase [Salinicoccus luteus]